jgi:arginase
LFPKGVETLPDALLAEGLGERLEARRAGRVEPPPYDYRRDPETMLLNPRGIADYSVALADVVERVIDTGEFPVVLGGDCSIVLGCLLALRRRGRHGLLFLDGHADFYQPEAEPNGEAASMELALATGRGPAVVTDLEGRRPRRDEDVESVAATLRLPKRTAANVSKTPRLGLSISPAAQVKKPVAPSRTCPDPIDADVLDDAVMPAVDYRMPGGLSWWELATILQVAIASGQAIDLNITIFNPKLDSDGSIAAAFVDALVKGLRS